jgi:HEAT repeat protein
MKRLMVLGVIGLLLGLGGLPTLFGQKQKGNFDAPELKEIPSLVEQLKSKDAATRSKAAERLGMRAQLRAKDIIAGVPTLMEMAKSDSDSNARAQAAKTLGYGTYDPEKVVPLLIGVLKEDKDLPVKTAAATALGYFGRDAKDALPALQEAQAMARGADKTEKDKQALGKAAGTAINMINEKAKKK